METLPGPAWYLKRMRNLRNLLVFLLQSVLVGLAVAFVVVYFKPSLLGPSNAVNSAPAPGSYAMAVARSTAAVVNVHTAKRVVTQRHPFFDDPLWQRLFGDQFAPRERLETSLGSGVLASADGYILTNYHVIQGADAIQIALADGRVLPAAVVGTDPETDLAVLKIEADKLPTVAMGNSETLRVGDVVLAIGTPFGLGQTVTQGIISATGRGDIGLTTFENFIQTDAAINMGNSGGALINTRGELVGVNTALLSRSGESNGIGFAIPVNLARGVMQQIIAHGRVIRGWLGVVPQPLTPQLAEAFRLNDIQGVLIREITPGSPAEAAGLQSGDVITHIGGEPIQNSREALNRVATMQPGEKVELRGVRNSQPFTLTATIGERATTQSS